MKLSSISITEKYFTEVVRMANKDRSTSLNINIVIFTVIRKSNNFSCTAIIFIYRKAHCFEMYG